MKLYLPLPPKALAGNKGDKMHWSFRAKAMTASAEDVLPWRVILSAEAAVLKQAVADGKHIAMVVGAIPAKPGHTPKRVKGRADTLDRCCPDDQDNGVPACKGYRDALAKMIGVDDRVMHTQYQKLSRDHDLAKHFGEEGGIAVRLQAIKPPVIELE
jgi:hypothetical protein